MKFLISNVYVQKILDLLHRLNIFHIFAETKKNTFVNWMFPIFAA